MNTSDSFATSRIFLLLTAKKNPAIQRHQVENVPRTLGHVYETQNGHKTQIARNVPFDPEGFFRDVFAKQTRRKNDGGTVVGLENRVACQICRRYCCGACEGGKNGFRVGG